MIVTAAHCIQDFGRGNSLSNLHSSRALRSCWGNRGSNGALWNVEMAYVSASQHMGQRHQHRHRRCQGQRHAVIALAGMRRVNSWRYHRVHGLRMEQLFILDVAKDWQSAYSRRHNPRLSIPDGWWHNHATDGWTDYTTALGGAGLLWQGSNLPDGSSGGPWVVNFRTRAAALAGGAVEGSAAGIAVIGVTSWGSSDPNAIKDNWSSQFRQNTRVTPMPAMGSMVPAISPRC